MSLSPSDTTSGWHGNPALKKKCDKSENLIPKLLALCRNNFHYGDGACRIMFDGTASAHRLQTYAKLVAKVDWKITVCCGRLYKTASYLPATVNGGRIPPALTTTTFARIRAASKGFLLYGYLKISQPQSTSPSRAAITLPYDDATAIWEKWYAKCPKEIVDRGINTESYSTPSLRLRLFLK